ncbi:Signal transduction histidine-protein kinase/phosphatase DegS [Agrobacterium sp. DSM 25558]|uniref:sensor histidine kinase n=1 Tax=Agrobacterium sp. DSM 25558 TaxID=1907665 RepID=UPI0009725A01|nr:sensor histidine kinase [Agrobacterium sp. DSM 25558]SCX16716.1 Signal transduction histidine-protein kinase/phosphatase DegS [Agrobacterium sp. DSM 25558]
MRYFAGREFVSLSGRRPTLAWQFAFAGTIVLLLGMILIGLWVTSKIESAAVRNMASGTALYVSGIVSPLTQELATSSSLSDDARGKILDTLNQGPLRGELFSFKIWGKDNRVVFSSEPGLIGKTFEGSLGLSTAFNGTVHAAFDDLEGEEHEEEKRSGQVLLEIHSPIRDAVSGRVIAVAEFYERSADLMSELDNVRYESWLVVAGVTAGMLVLLFGIVAKGSHLIEAQKRSLHVQVTELSRMLEVNRDLRQRVDQATQRTAALNERYLRRISAELHDGPAQLLGFAALRLEAIRTGRARDDDEAMVQHSIDEAVREIRGICRGLNLPELEGLSGEDVVRRLITTHEKHSGRSIQLDIAPLEVSSQAMKICIYRFLQEALSNATRHAQSADIAVSASETNGEIVIGVRDNGIGFVRRDDEDGLGLAGLEERAAGLGGRLTIVSAIGSGTSITMTLPRVTSS